MSTQPPGIDAILARIKTDQASNQITTSEGLQAFVNVSDKDSPNFAIMVGMAGISNSLYKYIELNVIPNAFLLTAKTLEDLQKFADLWNLPRNPASGSSGLISFSGTVGVTIPLGTTLTANSITYTVLSTVAISTDTINVSSITRSGSTASVTTAANHNFASGQSITIAGANETDYNGIYIITVTALDEFSYTVSGTPSTPATGTITASGDIASAEVESTETGSTVNLDNGDTLQLVNGIAGVNNTAFVQFGGVQGGTNEESFESWKARLIERQRNPITCYNEANIELEAKKVSGVTKVWVFSITPAIGQVTVYFIRGNDDNIIPSASEVAQVKDAILANTGGGDADRSENNLFVTAPTPVSTNFVFSAISPDTPTMRTAIENNLSQFFSDKANVSEDVTQLQYNNAIGGSFDLETGESLVSYTLTSPAADITIATGELATLGAVSF